MTNTITKFLDDHKDINTLVSYGIVKEITYVRFGTEERFYICDSQKIIVWEYCCGQFSGITTCSTPSYQAILQRLIFEADALEIVRY